MPSAKAKQGKKQNKNMKKQKHFFEALFIIPLLILMQNFPMVLLTLSFPFMTESGILNVIFYDL